MKLEAWIGGIAQAQVLQPEAVLLSAVAMVEVVKLEAWIGGIAQAQVLQVVLLEAAVEIWFV